VKTLIAFGFPIEVGPFELIEKSLFDRKKAAAKKRIAKIFHGD
jgi:hypothetical protein